MRLYIKNMVCQRCILAVKQELEKLDLKPLQLALGEVDLAERPTEGKLAQLILRLQALGFELIDDKKSRIIEQIKTLLIKLVHHSGDPVTVNLSDYISGKLHYDYSYLSNLFSEVESTTIEKYFITQKIEKAKELLVYDELTLSEIADRLGYSSVAYLSAQFKKIAGFTPTHYKSLREHKRKNIEDL